jgi:hypothetical protein
MQTPTDQATLPPVLLMYLAARTRDANFMRLSFTEDAYVLDRGKLYKGLDSMVAWQEELGRYYPERRFEVLKVTHHAQDEYHVQVRVTGPFTRGTPVRWLFRFKLRGDRIAVLEIV